MPSARSCARQISLRYAARKRIQAAWWDVLFLKAIHFYQNLLLHSCLIYLSIWSTRSLQSLARVCKGVFDASRCGVLIDVYDD